MGKRENLGKHSYFRTAGAKLEESWGKGSGIDAKKEVFRI